MKNYMEKTAKNEYAASRKFIKNHINLTYHHKKCFFNKKTITFASTYNDCHID